MTEIKFKDTVDVELIQSMGGDSTLAAAGPGAREGLFTRRDLFGLLGDVQPAVDDGLPVA